MYAGAMGSIILFYDFYDYNLKDIKGLDNGS
jgi:hypothetical protein